MLARLHGADAQIDVRVGARADADQINMGIGDEIFRPLVAAHARWVKRPALAAGGVEVSADIAELAGAARCFSITYRDEVVGKTGAVRRRERSDVRRAHETEADDAETDGTSCWNHGRNSLPQMGHR